jgi:hypothetical protein
MFLEIQVLEKKNGKNEWMCTSLFFSCLFNPPYGTININQKDGARPSPEN